MTVLDPGAQTTTVWIEAAATYIASFLDGLDLAPAIGPELPVELTTRLSAPPRENPGRFDDLLATFGNAARHAVETAGPWHFAFVPGGGLVSSAIAEMLARTVNRYTSVAAAAPGLVAMEHGVLRWLCSEFGLPSGAGGLVTTGTSTSTLSVVAAARLDRLGPDFGDGTIYVGEHTHRCVAKAAWFAGFQADRVRIVPCTPDLRMDAAAAARMIDADRRAGFRPFLLVGTAGTIDTGAIDPLLELATLARRQNLWLHIDAAYGGFFQLTARGRELLVGIASADSITLDPHKGLFLPHGTGVLLVRDTELLRAVHAESGDYLQDIDPHALPNFADLGIELTREFRGLRLWIPLHLHGLAAFRAELDEKLDLAIQAYETLNHMPGIHVPWRPELSTVVFRDIGGDTATRRLHESIHASGRTFLSSTRIRGRTLLRMCILSHRTRPRHVADALDIIRAAAAPTAPHNPSPAANTINPSAPS